MSLEWRTVTRNKRSEVVGRDGDRDVVVIWADFVFQRQFLAQVIGLSAFLVSDDVRVIKGSAERVYEALKGVKE